MQDAIESSTPSQVINHPPPASPDVHAPGQTLQTNGKPFVLGTLDAEEIQQYVTDWIQAALGYGCDATEALKHHVAMVIRDGASAGFGTTHASSVQACLIDSTMRGEGTDKLFGPMAAADIFPNVDWRRACEDALKRIDNDAAEYQARCQSEREARERAKVEAQTAEESSDSAVSETPAGRGVARLHAIRRKSDGEFHANDINAEPLIMQVHCFASFDEAAAARLLFSKPEDEIVPLIELSASDGQLAEENAKLKLALGDLGRQIGWMQRDETPEPELEPLPAAETLDASGAVVSAIEDELSWLSDADVVDADKGRQVEANLRDFFKLIDRFDGSCRIRKTRPDDDEPKRRLVIETSTGHNVLPARASDQVIGTMVDRKLCEFDAAGVLHVADKGRALIGAK